MKKQTTATKIIIGVLSFLAVAAIVISILGRFVWNWGPEWMFDYMRIGGFMMPLGMIVFWGIVIYVVFRGWNRGHACHQTSSLQVLKDRLARGEITIEEYETIVKKIKEEN